MPVSMHVDFFAGERRAVITELAGYYIQDICLSLSLSLSQNFNT
jgi:hypothetical protein